MKHDIEILIGKLFNGSISEKEKRTLMAWYNESNKHKTLFNEFRSLWFATHPTFNPASIDTAKAEKKILARIHKKPSISVERFSLIWQKTAAILLLPFIGCILYLWMNPVKTDHLIFAMQEITVLPGTRTKVNLPDGSQVWLNSGSKLTYPSTFNTKKREVSLSGEGYFNIHANKTHPFIISTNGINICVTGTQLNVEAYPEDTLQQVTLAEGKAEIWLPERESNPIHLKPNEQFSFNTHTRKHNLVKTEASNSGEWRDGILIFRDEKLENVFKRLSRTFNINIRIKDAALAQQRYRATFKDESLVQILDLLQQSAPLEYTYTKEKGKEVIDVYLKK